MLRDLRKRSIPVALTIAGSDSSAGAGLQADLKVFAARGVYGVNAVTSVVAETPGKVARFQKVEPDLVRTQISLLRQSFPIRAAKTGMLACAETVRLVARSWRSARIPLVVDPVMIATSGARLLEPGAVESYERHLFPLAQLLTPNLVEAECLLGDQIGDLKELRAAAAALEKKYRTAVLLKGGHLRGKEAIDVLALDGKLIEFRADFVPNVKTHGTGCTYSAAITAELAKGRGLIRAVQIGKEVVTAAIRDHYRWRRDRATLYALNQSTPPSTRSEHAGDGVS